MIEKMLMNTHTGTVQSQTDWMEDAALDGWDYLDADLVAVVKDERGEWIEATE